MIPKIIHQIWIGDNPLPEKWLNSWKKTHPDFDYNLWNEKSIDKLDLINRHIYDKFSETNTYNGMCNVVRIELLYRFGGIYLDADLLCKRKINESWLEYDIVGVESPNKNGLIQNAVMMSKPKHPLMKQYMDILGEVEDIHPSFKKTGSGLMTPIFRGKIKVLPAWTFFPINMKGKKLKNADKSYATHFYGTTFNRY